MKKRIVFLSLLISMLLMLMCSITAPKVNAAENTWYTSAAAEADNPVLLEDEEYYQGVSINSHLISDLTFLRIPFKKYVNQKEKQIQIITFAEGCYKVDGELENDVVLYLYAPQDYFRDIKSVDIKISNPTQELLIDDEMQEVTGLRSESIYTWTKISEYGSIYKFSFSKRKDTPGILLKKLLLKEYNTSQNHTLVSTIFEAKINTLYYENGTSDKYELLDNVKSVIPTQEFNFIYEKNVQYPEAVALLSDDIDTGKLHLTTSIGYNETRAKVDGSIFRLRFRNEDLSSEKISLFQSSYALENKEGHTDFFYYFFNVKESESGRKWTGNEVIEAINYTYYDYLVEYATKYSGVIIGIESNDANSRVTYFTPNGDIYAQDINKFDIVGYKDFVESAEYKGETIFDMISYREPSSLKDIYKTRTIKAGTFEHKYPMKKDSISIKDFILGNTTETYKTTLPYVFSTSDTKFVEETNYNLTSDIKTSDFQFGMLVGSEGYPAVTKAEANSIVIATWGTTYSYQCQVELIGLNEIWYTYEGEKYHAEVDETIVDNSNINKPIIQDPQDPDFNPLFPTEKVPEEKSFIEWILYYLELIWNWIKDNHKLVVGVIVFVTAAIIISKIVRNTRQDKANKAIIEVSKRE